MRECIDIFEVPDEHLITTLHSAGRIEKKLDGKFLRRSDSWRMPICIFICLFFVDLHSQLSFDYKYFNWKQFNCLLYGGRYVDSAVFALH